MGLRSAVRTWVRRLLTRSKVSRWPLSLRVVSSMLRSQRDFSWPMYGVTTRKSLSLPRSCSASASARQYGSRLSGLKRSASSTTLRTNPGSSPCTSAIPASASWFLPGLTSWITWL